jgi:hypothetical protein
MYKRVPHASVEEGDVSNACHDGREKGKAKTEVGETKS